MTKLYVLLGGNLGNKEEIFSETRSCLMIQVGELVSLSHVYETEPWGFESGDFFWNQVLEMDTKLTPVEILEKIQQIEIDLGRIRKTDQYISRTIDIDILFYGSEIVRLPNLTIPHPRIQERKFALVPLNEVAPELIHPILKKTISQLLADCNDQLRVEVK